MDRIKTTLYLPTDLHDRVKEAAARRGWTVTYVINRLLTVWLNGLDAKSENQGGVESRG